MPAEIYPAELKTSLIERARSIACCPHVQTCRAEFAAVKKDMPLASPSPDYIGARYRGLVVIGGNPGLAHSAIHHENDKRMFALQKRIALGDNDAFDQLMSFFPQSMAHWRQMVNLDARVRLDYDIEEIAYVDIVKCATRPLGSDPYRLFNGTRILRRCWITHTQQVLDLLNPSHIVGLWQPIIPTLRRLGFSFKPGTMRGCYIGQRSLTNPERYSDVFPVFDSFRQSPS